MNYLQKELYECCQKDAELFFFLQNQAVDGFWFYNVLHAQDIWLNPRLKIHLGYTIEQEISSIHVWQQHLLPDSLKKLKTILTEPATTLLENSTIRYIDNKKQVITFKQAIFVVKNQANQIQYILGGNTLLKPSNIQKNKHKNIRQDQQFLQFLIDNIPINIYVKDLESRKILINRQELNHMGIEDENEVLGKNDFDLYPYESAIVSRTEDLEVLEKGIPFIDMETFNIKKDGTQKWFLASKIPLRDENNKIYGLLGLSYDITKHKLAEQQARKYSIIEAKSKEMEQLAYIASHDLREPLLTIRSYIEILLEDYLEDTDEEALKIGQFIISAASRMEMLIKGLLDYSSLSQKKELETVDCNLLLQDLIADLNSSIQRNHATINVAPLPIIQAYPLQLKQIFQNLISNALKFKTENTPPTIHISHQKIKGGWEFKIKDNGIGIAKKDQEKIFQLFKRLHSKQKYVGTGIGLANCKKIAELHNGNIWLESKVGEYSIFYFSILTEKT